MLRRICTLIILLVIGMSLSIPMVSAQDAKTFALTVMHTNDEHSHHDLEGAAGGMAREMTVIKQIRAEAKNSLLLDAGDRFTGTLYFRQYQGLDSAELMNRLGYAATTLGNHEFDNGDEVLAKFIEALKFPVISTNIDFSASKALNEKTKPFAILDVGGEKIGVIGITTAETPTISSPSKGLKFNAEYATVVQATVDKLTAQGTNKIILLTHIGYLEDLKLAPQLSGVDLIVGGHSHTLLSNTYTEAGKEVYPAALKSKSGEPIYVVQAGSYGKYLGRIDLVFDAAGIIQKATGDTILLSKYITPDSEIAGILDEMSGQLKALQTKEILTAKGEPVTLAAVLSNKTCRLQECELGDLVADAVRANTHAQIVIINGGGLRADLPEGKITVGNVMTVLPFGNLISTFKLTGTDVVVALENGATALGSSSTGRYPQVSGLRFTLDSSKPAGSRIVSVEVLGDDGKYAPIDPAATYALASNDFMHKGGDGYTVFAEKGIDAYDFGDPLDQVLIDYLAANSPLTIKLEGRIVDKAAK
jgi:5'-nucleotidase